MKCDELEAYGMNDPAIGDEYEMYKVSDVDAAIEELKEVYKDSVDVKVKIWERYKKAEDELRKTQRALWLDRAIRAEHMKILIFEGELIYHDDSGEELDWRIMYRKWERAETACRAKAKEYK